MLIMNIEANKYKLNNCGRINILLGKNGYGKSTTLKEAAQALKAKSNGLIKYITPERGGSLEYQPNIEQNMDANKSWVNDTRNNNQYGQFRQQSVVLFKNLRATTHLNLENCIKKEKESGKDNVSISLCESHLFDKHIHQINSLLDNIHIESNKTAFAIFSKSARSI